MLRFLSIRHLAIIEALEVDLGPGLTVLTGETGAGKSILVEAIGLLLGGRASQELIRTGSEQARIQAVFEDPKGHEIIVRRDIAATGRSRAYIDDALATSAALRGLTENLVDLHGQHEHQLLLDPRTHLDLLDEYGRLNAERSAVSAAFVALRDAESELTRRQRGEGDRRAHLDSLRYELDAIDRVNPRAGEDEELEATARMLANAENLQRLCKSAYERLYEADEAVLTGLAGVWRDLAELAALDDTFAPYLEFRESVVPPLEDMAFHLRSYGATLDASPERLEEVQGRLAAIERLKKKHGPTLDAILTRRAAMAEEIERVEHAAERQETLQQAVEEARTRYMATAARLSKSRRQVAPRLSGALDSALEELAMDRAHSQFRLESRDGTSRETERGLERGELYLSTNPGEDLRPLARIASGGELSRVMLALKTLASIDTPGKTLVFDEVDAGIGGRVADVVGRKLRELADRAQVICITHLPQIAAYGTRHLRLTKVVEHQRTVTHVTPLAGEARVEEIARMIAGARVSDRTRLTAGEMLAGRSTRTDESEQITKAKRRGAPHG